MEVSFHMFQEDVRRLEELIKKTDLVRENHIVELVSRYMLAQIDDETTNSKDLKPMAGVHLGYVPGRESERSTVAESPDPIEIDECS
jgi:hypothetical protein